MNKAITLIVTFGIFFALAGQKNQVDEKGRKQGEWVKYYPNSVVPIYIGQFKDDKPIGTFTYYYPSKKVKSIVKHNPETGRSQAYFYHENKKLLAFGIYMNQQKDSVWTHYGPSGRISFRETYKNGELHGLKTIYYVPELIEDRTVEPMSEKNYENGRLNGPAKEYFPGGVTKLEGFYKDGVFEGEVKHYHPNGKLHYVERWKDRRKHGWWIVYDEQGKERSRKFYNHNVELKGDRLKKHLQKLKEQGKNPNE